MRIVRFKLEPWQKGGSTGSGFSSTSSLSSTFPPLSDSVLRRQRASPTDELSNIDTNLFERRSHSQSQSNSRHSTYSKRKLPQMVKRLTVLCSDVLARNVNKNHSFSFLSKLDILLFKFKNRKF